MAAQWDGRQLSAAELLGFCVLLLVAGNETTTNLITNAVGRFADPPEILEQFRQHPEQLPLAIEEILRYRSPVQSMYRICRQDTSLAACVGNHGEHPRKKGFGGGIANGFL